MEFFFIIIFEIFMLVCEYVFLNGRFVSISFVSTATILMSTIAAVYSRDLWNLSLDVKTIVVICVGIVTMFIAEKLSTKIVISKKKNLDNYRNPIKIIKFKKTTLFIINAFIILSTMLYLIEVFRVGTLLGGRGLNCFAIVKDAYMSDVSTYRMNFIIRQLYKPVIAFSYIFVYIVINNLLVQKKVKGQKKYMIPIIFGILITIISGSRGDILKLLAAAILDYYIIVINLESHDIKIKKEHFLILIQKGIPFVLIVFILLFVSRNVVKTSDVATSKISNLVDYLAFYAGSSIGVLNEKINIKYSEGGFLIGNSITVPNFVYLGNLNYGGNVATFFGKTLFMHGFIFLTTYTFIVYFIFGYFMKSLEKNMYSKNGISIRTIIFSYMYSVFIFSFYDDLFFQLLSTSNIFTIIVIVVICSVIRKYCIFLETTNEVKENEVY